MTTGPVEHTRLARLERYVRFLDEGIRVPGTNFRIGLDPILGLIPGAGDAIGAVLAAAIILEGARRGVSSWTLLRMAFNVALDAGFGAVPVVGDVVDALFKANRRNLALLERSLGQAPADRCVGIGLIGLLAGLLVLCIGVAGTVTYVILSLLGVLGG